MWSEVTSVLNEMRWRGEVSEALADSAFERLLAAPIARTADASLYTEAREVARELGWAKTYDAEYVSLARIHKASLLSRDERLRRGAGRVVTVVSPDEVIPPERSGRVE
jgi:predicted nucleic acid-binding protein